MNGTADTVVVLTLPDGACAAFAAGDVMDARRRAAALGFGPVGAPPSADGAAPQRLLNSKELGALIGVNATLIEQMAKDHRIPAVRIGRLLRFEPAAVLAALRAVGNAP
jgi:excisionase family DNA binding protein